MYDTTGSTDENMFAGSGGFQGGADPFSVFNEFFKNFGGNGRGSKANNGGEDNFFFNDFESFFSDSQQEYSLIKKYW